MMGAACWARQAYAGVLRLGLPLFLARVWRRGRQEPDYTLNWPQRLGLKLPAAEPGALWVHAVSLGETKAAGPLIEALRAQRPGLRLLLTHTTATGRAAGQALLRPGDVQTWLPYDTPGAVRRFLRHFRPALGVLMETEIWPVLLHEARQAGVPMVLANARLSEKSAARGRALSALLRPAAQALTLALAQTPADAQRLSAAGVRSTPVMGNLKFDLDPPPAQLQQGQQWRQALGRPVLLLANARDGEEAALLAAWKGLAAPRPLLLIVPRHPQRFDEVARLIEAEGWSLARRSAWATHPDAQALAAEVWLGDSLGELAAYYACADVALLGGSFMPLGGHNLIESLASACPIVLGPSTFNFMAAADGALAVGAAWRAANLGEAVLQGLRVVQHAELRVAAAQAATRFAAEHRGAAHRMAQAILAELPQPASASSGVQRANS